jgi:ParB-like chromosome segregation protein Spo0J
VATEIRRVALDKLVPHPDNPNLMSRANFAKLVRHIERTGRYEPLVVRPHPERAGDFQIINGHHRCEALRQLGHETADVVVWDASDEETAILLTTLNRLGGRDVLDKKLALLRRLRQRMLIPELARLLPQTRSQLERLTARRLLPPTRMRTADAPAIPLVFFVDESQRSAIEEALSLAGESLQTQPKAIKRAAALAHIARDFRRRIERPQQGQ